MQDKETVDDAEEALTNKAETVSDRRTSFENTDAPSGKESSGKKESTKDGKFAFRRMKQPKKEKSTKNNPTRFEGEGIVFKAKLIGVEPVSDARGDKMCQEAMQKLKQNVKSTGPHKRKINVCVSLQGIKIKDEKNANVIYHHPVNLISFISQDITDARAFGYVFGSTEEPHQFIAIKTEKPAFHVVVAIRDLFQTVLDFKQEEIEIAKENKNENQKNTETDCKTAKIQEEEANKIIEENKSKEENIYFEVLLTEPLKMKEEEEETEKAKESEPVKTVDDLLGLQDELNKLKEGINQMDTSIAASAALDPEGTTAEADPFDTSFVLGPKRDSFPLPMPTPIPLVSTIPNNEFGNTSNSEDKYAVFTTIDSTPSVFETIPSEIEEPEQNAANDAKEQEEKRKTAPAKPPRSTKSSTPDLSIFADLDPLGKDRPYKDKTEFFQDVKNPPKKVLNDLVDPNKEAQKPYDGNLFNPSVPFPVDFDSNHSPPFPNPALSSSLPNSFYANPKLSVPLVQNVNGDTSSNPFEIQDNNNLPHPKLLKSRASEPIFNFIQSQNGNVMSQNIVNASYLGKSPPSSTILGPTQQLTINTNNNVQIISQNSSSSPIPIPPRQTNFTKDRSFSSCSTDSPYSKSPIPYNSESPNHADYYQHIQTDNYSPNGLILKNGTHTPNQYSNGDNLPTISPPTYNTSRQNNANLHNGVSRPRPRPSLSKGSSVPSSGHSNSSHSVSSDSSSDYEAISRENMQSIANVLLTSGHRLRAQSLCFETNNEYNMNGDKNIFAKKNDPFADDFFFSLPKKASHLVNTEIPEYV